MPRFNAKKWIEVHDQSGGTYKASKQIRFETSLLRSNLCDCPDAYMTVARANNRDRTNRDLVNDVLNDNADDLGVVMSTNNLIK